MAKNSMSGNGIKQCISLLSALFLFIFSFGQNPIITENALTGNPASEWDISGAGNTAIQGFATDISVNKGTRVNFKINTSSAFTYTIKIYRLGYYQGNGARLIVDRGTFTGTVQPAPFSDAQTGLVDCGNWSISAFWDVPSTAVSGVYIAKLARTGSPATSSHIVFVVRDDASTSDLFFQTSDASWQAYNNYGGNSLYVGATSYPGGHATKVSYNRPFLTRNGGGGGGVAMDWLFNAEYPMIRFLERNGYNMSYTTNVDAARRGNLIQNHKVFISTGHDEYWSAEQRTNVEAARNAGVDLAFFSGNEVYWKTRWENSQDGSNTAYRTLVCYKEGTLGENQCGSKCDLTSSVWTGLWRDGCSNPGSGGCNPENALTGQMSWRETTGPITVPSEFKSLRFWRGTSVASLGDGQEATLTDGALGYEWDQDQYPESYPAGRIVLSRTDVSGDIHKLSLYRHSSGAFVFGAGTVQWSWGLDANHDRGTSVPSKDMQQATVNLFADMGAQPGSLMAGLISASATTDVTAPQVTISFPLNGATVSNGTPITITGTASDVGGVIAGIEISLDGGLTWKQATGTTTWTYSWSPSVEGTVNIRVRGFDDSGNIGVAGAIGSSSNINVTVTAPSAPTCTNCTIFQSTTEPATLPVQHDGMALELGVKFNTTQNGFITGIRFYKGAGVAGTHIGSLWTSTGTRLAQATFINETASGWQQVLFSAPVAINAGTTYVASYFSSSGDYIGSNPFFTVATFNNPLRALGNGEDGPNGLYKYTTSSSFPDANYQTSNYWVDVVYTPGADNVPPTVTTVLPANSTTGVAIGTTVTANFSEAMTASTLTTTNVQLKDAANNVIAATLSTTSTQVVLTPSSPLTASTTYTATVKGGSTGVKDIAGNALASNFNWSFTTAVPDVTAPTVSSVSPANAATAVQASTSVTVVFSEPMNPSTISQSRFQLKDPGGNPVAVTLNLGPGQVTLTPDVLLSFSTVYTLTVTGGVNGVKDIAGNSLASDFTSTFTTTETDVTAPTITSVIPANSATNVAISTTVTAAFSEPMNASTINSTTVQLKDPLNNVITASLNISSAQVILTPSATLSNSTIYTVTIKGGTSGVTDAIGNPLAGDFNWSFTTVAGSSAPVTVFQSSTVPSTLGVENDGSAIELGFKFRSTQSGFITGIRFYKATGVTGTHTGNLWSSTGTNLGRATFINETASGWQEVFFASPVPITANTTYIASYFSASGQYISTNSFFTSATVNSPLRGLANGEDGPNGLYKYSTTTAFPDGSFQAGHYWMDVVYVASTGAPDVTPPTVSAVTPVNGATDVAVGGNMTATFSEAITNVTTTTVQLKTSGGTLIPSTVSVNSNVVTITPSSPLSFSAGYVVTITGGASGVKDAAGNALAANYTWSFTTVATDVTPPTVTSVVPVAGATGVGIGSTVTANFSEAMNVSSITAATVQLKDPSSNVIAATLAVTSTQVVLTPSAPLNNSTTYSVTIKSGASGVKDVIGNALAADYTWSFTTGAPSLTPVTVFQSSTVPVANAVENDGSGIELGMKIRSSQSGYITGIRYYKPVGATGVHLGNLWSSSGVLLAQATFINETASGWQDVAFPTPVAISANTTYIASYFSTSGDYISYVPYFTTGVDNSPLRALANNEDGPNGLYRYTATSAFPNATFNAGNYWVDVVYVANAGGGPDVTPPTVLAVSPVSGATGIGVTSSITATFSEPVNSTTVTASSFILKDAANNTITATLNTSSNQVTLIPSSALSYSTVYTVTIKSGATGVKDLAGNALASDYTSSFTTASAPAVLPPDGSGGPILIVSSSANPFSRYTMELLRAEGLNEFLAKDISQVTVAELNNYDVVVLGEIPVTGAQVTMFSDWVNAGGTLISFRPSNALSSLLGISNAAGTLANQYLLVNTTSGAGVGIVGQTIQFHGTADLHTLNGATSLATLYSTATTATTNPAVTTRTVGTSGGRAIGFMYDLARSVVYTRQGNPDWAGQERDGQAPVRSDDMFYGSGGPNWIDFNKVAIPQADEQQRLLANIIIQGNLHRKPLPRFWYLPKGLKAAIVMTGDDHATNGTPGRFDKYMTLGPNTAQDVADWNAVRGTSYVYSATAMTDAQAADYQSKGFEVALHPNTLCVDYTLASIQNTFTTQLAEFRSKFPSLTGPVTNRTHCLVWSDWASQAIAEGQSGMRLDVTYYNWPEQWMQNIPGMFTGSGMPMRFANLDGSAIDVYQVPTQMTDETNMNYTTFTNALLDKAIGAEGYYGVFCANMHTDEVAHAGSDAIIASAQARQIPVISAKQMLTWLDGRNASSFGTITWNNSQLSFTITAPTDARNLKTMLPVNAENGTLTSITRNGSSIAFTTQMIKGILYAFFDAAAGTNSYVANYGAATGGIAPVVITQPVAKTACVNTSVSYTSAANGTPTPTVQWQQTTDGTNWTDIAGATNATLTFTVVAGDNGKQYRAVWTNSAGTANSNAAALTLSAPPATPTVAVVNNCVNAVLTASGVTGTLLWSTGATTASITVTNAAAYTVTQTVNGCTSLAGSGTSAPKGTPVTPTVTVVNNCGNALLTATNVTGTLLWSNAATTASITVTNAAAYTVTQTVNGCTSTAGSGTSAPKAVPAAPTVSVSGATTFCQGGTVTLTSSVATGNTWSTGATTQAIVVTATGNYTVTTTNAGGCVSAPSAVRTVTVNPRATLTSSLTAAATSGATFAYTATSATAGTTYSWTRAAVTGISNAASSGTGNISQILVNTTDAPVNVTYIYTLTANGCTNTQNVVVTVSPAPIACTSSATLTSTFNSSTIPSGRYIWFNSAFDPVSLGTTGAVTFYVTNSVIKFTANSTQYTITAPNSKIRFDANVTSATTTWANNRWETVVPIAFNDFVFLSGTSYQVPANLPANITNVVWTATIGVDRAATSTTWKWAAATYSLFTTNSGINVKPVNGSAQNPYSNTDPAGSPQNALYKLAIVSGARTTGGTNYTGTYTSTATNTCVAGLQQRSSVIEQDIPLNTEPDEVITSLQVKVTPNPTSSYFTAAIRSQSNEPVTVRIIDMVGRVVERHDKVSPNTTLQLGRQLRGNTYLAEIIQGDQRRVVKIVKTD